MSKTLKFPSSMLEIPSMEVKTTGKDMGLGERPIFCPVCKGEILPFEEVVFIVEGKADSGEEGWYEFVQGSTFSVFHRACLNKDKVS